MSRLLSQPRYSGHTQSARLARRACLAVGMRGVMAMVLTGAVVMAGCGGDGRPTAEDGQPRPSPPTSSRPGTTATVEGPATPAQHSRRGLEVKISASDYGPMLFDRSGQAIYLFDEEATSTPECYGACAKAWPPVLTMGSPQGSGATRDQLLGTARRKDGSQQVTYDGHPLYYYAHEGKNEVLCHQVSEFGGVWLVVTPSGEPAA